MIIMDKQITLQEKPGSRHDAGLSKNILLSDIVFHFNIFTIACLIVFPVSKSPEMQNRWYPHIIPVR